MSNNDLTNVLKELESSNQGKEILEAYRKLDWSFLKRHLINLYSIISMGYLDELVYRNAKDFSTLPFFTLPYVNEEFNVGLLGKRELNAFKNVEELCGTLSTQNSFDQLFNKKEPYFFEKDISEIVLEDLGYRVLIEDVLQLDYLTKPTE